MEGEQDGASTFFFASGADVAGMVMRTFQPYMLAQVSTIHNTTLKTQIKGHFHEDVPTNYKSR